VSVTELDSSALRGTVAFTGHGGTPSQTVTRQTHVMGPPKFANNKLGSWSI
jgi:hypothetical protein